MSKFLLFLFLSVFILVTQSNNSNAQQAVRNKKISQKIEDLRKIKLLEVLQLEGNQVENFFSVYNKHQQQLSALRTDIESSSKALQEMLNSGASDNELTAKVEALRKLNKNYDAEEEARFDAVKSILTANQFARYVVFETRFHDELQRKIIERMKNRRNK